MTTYQEWDKKNPYDDREDVWNAAIDQALEILDDSDSHDSAVCFELDRLIEKLNKLKTTG